MFKSAFFISGGALAALLWYASPMFKPFPEPNGPYQVGTFVAEFADQSRKETFSDNPDENRMLSVRFFYPRCADCSAQNKYEYLGKKMPYFEKYIAAQYHLPDAIAKLLFRNIHTHSYNNAPLATDQKSFPVVLFSHGLLGFPSDFNVVLLENLASHGFIVAAIDHPYFNGLTLYADGRVVTEKKLSVPFNKMRPQAQNEFLSQAIEIYKADMKFMIDELARLNGDNKAILYNRIDLNRIAAMGHSAGGTASIEFCRADERCKGAIDLDGWYNHVIGQDPINKPLLLIFAEKSLEVTEPTPEYLQRKELTREQYFQREKRIQEHREKLCSVPTCSMVIIPGATHSDFDDLMFIKWPFNDWNQVDPYKTMALINGHIIEFLNKYLK